MNRKCSFKFPTTFETGLSDHHRLLYLILKTAFQKKEPKILIQRDFKEVTYTDFQFELNVNLSEPNLRNSYEYCTFDKSFAEVLDKYVPKKRKSLCGNHKPHVNKTLHCAIMNCSQLEIKAKKLKSKNEYNISVVKLKKRCKKGFFDNLETRNKSKPF